MSQKDVDFDKLLKKQQEQLRRRKAIETVLRGIKYIMGYLPDYGFEIKPLMHGNPIEINLKIFWSEDAEAWQNTPTIVKQKLEKLEKDYLAVLKVVGNSEVSKPVHNNRTD